MISDIHSQPAPHRRRRAPLIQDEFTHRTDLTAVQKYKLRHPPSYFRPAGSCIRGAGAMREKRDGINLGLALVSLVAIPGVPLTAEDIAAWCDCSTQAIQRIEQAALRKLRIALFFRERHTGEELRAHLTLFADRQPAEPRKTRHAG